MAEALKNVGLGDATCPHSCTVETSLPWLSPQQSSFVFVQLEMGSLILTLILVALDSFRSLVSSEWNGLGAAGMGSTGYAQSWLSVLGAVGTPDHSSPNPHKVLLWIKLCFLLKGCWFCLFPNLSERDFKPPWAPNVKSSFFLWVHAGFLCSLRIKSCGRVYLPVIRSLSVLKTGFTNSKK